jgi:ribosomal subunit interface protein
MQFSFQFRGFQKSQKLVDDVQDRFKRLAHFELKPLKVRVTFSSQRHDHSVAVVVRGPSIFVSARAESESMAEALDVVMHRLTAQLSKRKKRVQKHKNPRLASLLRAS